jgi:hypothetical protein
MVNQPANLAGGEALVCLAERRIETPIEANHDCWVQRGDLYPTPIDPSHVEVDRLLAEHRLVGAGGAVSRSTCVGVAEAMTTASTLWSSMAASTVAAIAVLYCLATSCAADSIGSYTHAS